eukprot:CAMPEP_0183529488 /NCGR_PEP_ID=MMETSP0371-20130417/23452_1 /TAXON_ID=268820 /ORGANISM="Peridinium aciculiferum, Strain PAER-2" /LENGTH=77 /DNA_ID=CAMNT_0025729251 /DNA_START=18 /DNA_END=247 /DNA_ORIENTATION=+
MEEAEVPGDGGSVAEPSGGGGARRQDELGIDREDLEVPSDRAAEETMEEAEVPGDGYAVASARVEDGEEEPAEDALG